MVAAYFTSLFWHLPGGTGKMTNNLGQTSWPLAQKMITHHSMWSRSANHITAMLNWVKVKIKLSLCLTKHHAMRMYWVEA